MQELLAVFARLTDSPFLQQLPPFGGSPSRVSSSFHFQLPFFYRPRHRTGGNRLYDMVRTKSRPEVAKTTLTSGNVLFFVARGRCCEGYSSTDFTSMRCVSGKLGRTILSLGRSGIYLDHTIFVPIIMQRRLHRAHDELPPAQKAIEASTDRIVRKAGQETESEINAASDRPPRLVEIPAILDASKGRLRWRHQKQRQKQDLAPESDASPRPQRTPRSLVSQPPSELSQGDWSGRLERLLRMLVYEKEKMLPIVAGRALLRGV